MPRLTRSQAAVIGAYTGVACGPFKDVHEYVERLLGRPVLTHELPALESEIRQKAKTDFLAICYRGED